MDRPFSEFKNYISFLSNRGRDGKKLNTRREQSQIQKKKKIARRYYRDFPPKKPAPTKQKNIRGSQTSRHYYYYISPPFPRALFFACRPDSAPPVHLFQSELSFCVWESEGGTFLKKIREGVAFLFSVIQPEKAEEDFKNPSVPKTNLGENIRILYKTKWWLGKQMLAVKQILSRLGHFLLCQACFLLRQAPRPLLLCPPPKFGTTESISLHELHFWLRGGLILF